AVTAVIREQNHKQNPTNLQKSEFVLQPAPVVDLSKTQHQTAEPDVAPDEWSLKQPPQPLITKPLRTSTTDSNPTTVKVFDRQRLLAIDGNSFTLQLMLATDLKNIDQLIVNYQLEDASFRYSKQVGGQTHYCLLYGIYKTLEDAKTALVSLPKAIQQLDPFRKSFAAIHKELQLHSGH
ncbi:MAG: hypothetical protein JKY89_09850, partial [Immundisolibacteraceae bacterium]|nr:hypothetical protein [Immundisolibacteraceae bacterium]